MMTMSNQNQSGSSHHYPLDNLAYDVITIMHEKSKALEAYGQYMRDAEGKPEISNLLQQIRQQDEQHILQLMQCLRQMLSSHS